MRQVHWVGSRRTMERDWKNGSGKAYPETPVKSRCLPVTPHPRQCHRCSTRIGPASTAPTSIRPGWLEATCGQRVKPAARIAAISQPPPTRSRLTPGPETDAATAWIARPGPDPDADSLAAPGRRTGNSSRLPRMAPPASPPAPTACAGALPSPGSSTVAFAQGQAALMVRRRQRNRTRAALWVPLK